MLDNATDSFAQIAASRGVVTLNSSMGLQAFFHDKPVITLGQAFFNIAGLVDHAADQTALNHLFAKAPDRGYDAPCARPSSPGSTAPITPALPLRKTSPRPSTVALSPQSWTKRAAAQNSHPKRSRIPFPAPFALTGPRRF
ncbi:hypothetical protein ACFSHQ_08015 [Gemmobacter lanyuensis]